jgi:GT2 family glycosyltransferase
VALIAPWTAVSMSFELKEQRAAGTRHAGAAPRVSIVIPSYNHERFVTRAIESAFAQTYQDFEIVITDDASTDGSVDVLSTYARKDPRIRLFLNRFNYETHATNHCIQQSSGEYIAVLSSDDEFFPTKIEKQVDFLDRHPEVAAVFTQARIVDEQGRDFPERSHFYCTIFQQPNRSRYEWLRYFFFDGNCLCHPSVLIRRSVYDTLGLYNPLMGALDDLDMWVRVCLHHEIHILPNTLVNFRVRDGHANVSADTPENFRRGRYELIKILDHFVSPDALAQLHLIFPEFTDQVLHEPDAVKRHVLAMAALKSGQPSHRFWGIDLLYHLLSNPDAKRQLSHRISVAPDVDFVRTNGALNPFAIEHRASAQVFWPHAGAYSEVNSRSRYCPRSEWSELRFPLPALDTATPLRFDPCDCTGVVKISALKIVSQTDGRCFWTCALDKREEKETVTLAGTAIWLSDGPSVSILSTGNDPQMYLKGIPPLPDLPLELRVWIKLDPDLASVEKEIETLKGTAGKQLDELNELGMKLKIEVAEREGALERMTTDAESLRAAAVCREERLHQLESQVEALKEAVAERDGVAQRLERQAEALKASVAERESEITRLTTQTELLKATVAEGDCVTNMLLNSRSWRYTRPLRFLKQILRGLFGASKG